jgi:hypothetical protein
MTRTVSIRTPRAESKVAKATQVFCEMQGFSRKMVINRFQAELGLTEKGASTYYQNMRKKAGMVSGRASAGK